MWDLNDEPDNVDILLHDLLAGFASNLATLSLSSVCTTTAELTDLPTIAFPKLKRLSMPQNLNILAWIDGGSSRLNQIDMESLRELGVRALEAFVSSQPIPTLRHVGYNKQNCSNNAIAELAKWASLRCPLGEVLDT